MSESQGASAPTVFKFKSTEVRTVDRNGQVWFVASDIAKALDYRNAEGMARWLDDDEKGAHIVCTPSGDQEMIVINESGLYHAVLKSRKPEAVPFRKWVTSEVLPAIRRTGKYEGGSPVALPVPVDVISPQLRKAIERHAYTLTIEGFDRTRDSLEKHVRNFLDQGWTEEKVLKDLHQMGGILGDLKVVTVEELWDLCQNMSMAMLVMEKVMGQVRGLEEKVGHELYSRPRK